MIAILPAALTALLTPLDAPDWRDPDAELTRVDEAVAAALEDALEGSPVPGGVAGIVEFESGVRAAAFGVRKAGDDAAVTIDDPVHIGSDTKAMTAVLVARLVDKGLLEWDSTLADVLPKLAKKADPGWGDVTVLQLLRHTSGAPANPSDWGAKEGQKLAKRRFAIAADALSDAPRTEPGEAYEYSNLGYLLAGLFCEAAGDDEWEALIRREVFEPLGMTGVGFGPPGTKGKVDAPWGHAFRVGRMRPVQADNDPALGPAGTVHLPLEAWARFAMEFSDGAAEASDFLEPETRKKLLEVGVPSSSYACGWMVAERPWAGGKALSHSGSNTMWFATAWIAPARGRAYLVAVNAAGSGVPEAVDGAISALISLDAASKRGR
ncbi:MAG: serine hydrolase domain-containing protein [Planctomycetota bacterium]